MKMVVKNVIIESPPWQKKRTPYRIKYGMTMGEMAKLFGVTRLTIHNWMNNSKKKEWLEQKLKEINEC